MKKSFIYAMALLFATITLGGCSQESSLGGSQTEETGMESRGIVLTDSERDLAVAVPATASDRSKASGIKITSNAHSADLPGVLFIWDSKQRDNGYLKVESGIFDEYQSFVLTTKEANNYWDFRIELQPGQQMTADGCYMFFIPKTRNDWNINMVFLGEFAEKQEPAEPTQYVVSLLSGHDFGTPVTSVCEGLGGVPFQDVWDDAIQRDGFDAIADAVEREHPVWAWSRANSLETGYEGETVTYELEFNVEGETITQSEMLFAADNAMAVWVNGNYLTCTPASMFMGDLYVMDGSIAGWSQIVTINPELLSLNLRPGVNKIEIMARNAGNSNMWYDSFNSDPEAHTYDEKTNAGGLLFATGSQAVYFPRFFISSNSKAP